MLGKRPKYSKVNIIQDKTSKYGTNRMGNRNNTNRLGKKVYNNNNINRKEQSKNDNTNKLTKKKKTLANRQSRYTAIW